MIADDSIVITCPTMIDVMSPPLELTAVYAFMPVVVVIPIAPMEVIVDHYITMVPIETTKEKV